MVLLSSAFAPASVFQSDQLLAHPSVRNSFIANSGNAWRSAAGDAVLKLSISRLASRLLFCFQSASGERSASHRCGQSALVVVRLVCPGRLPDLGNAQSDHQGVSGWSSAAGRRDVAWVPRVITALEGEP